MSRSDKLLTCAKCVELEQDFRVFDTPDRAGELAMWLHYRNEHPVEYRQEAKDRPGLDDLLEEWESKLEYLGTDDDPLADDPLHLGEA